MPLMSSVNAVNEQRKCR